MSDPKQPTFYIPHGGGPCFFMDWTMGPADTWDPMAAFLRGLPDTLPARPKAILIISGHWEAPGFAVTSSKAPPLFYDYYGFPAHTYQLTWPAPGSPDLARQVRDLLQRAGLPAGEDPRRGFDHGVFIPFKLIYPEADIPVVQLSLLQGLDPEAHMAAGRALESLRSQGVLIVGSGMSFHNMSGYGDPRFGPVSDQFDDWLTGAAEAAPSDRAAALRQWSTAPSGRLSQPREEHLLPLMVAAGAAGDDLGHKVFSDRVMMTTVSAFRFG